jgi:hypothetical protein
MVYPVIPGDKKVIIAVENHRCAVARYIQMAPYTFTVQRAANWEALETRARQVVEDLVGAPVDDVYPCPDDLAALATWPE